MPTLPNQDVPRTPSSATEGTPGRDVEVVDCLPDAGIALLDAFDGVVEQNLHAVLHDLLAEGGLRAFVTGHDDEVVVDRPGLQPR